MGARRRRRSDMTVEQFHQWCDARDDVQQTLNSCDEEGGPRVSLVPEPRTVPLDFVPDDVVVPLDPNEGVVAFAPEASRKTTGWCAQRQKLFIEALAETGSVHLSARSAGLSARSAYGLRVRSPAFAAAWDTALQLAVGRLSALAFDRAIHGRVEQLYVDGELVGERRLPNDRMLTWLLNRLDPKRFALPSERGKGDQDDPQRQAQQAFPSLLDALADVAD